MRSLPEAETQNHTTFFLPTKQQCVFYCFFRYLIFQVPIQFLVNDFDEVKKWNRKEKKTSSLHIRNKGGREKDTVKVNLFFDFTGDQMLKWEKSGFTYWINEWQREGKRGANDGRGKAKDKNKEMRHGERKREQMSRARVAHRADRQPDGRTENDPIRFRTLEIEWNDEMKTERRQRRRARGKGQAEREYGVAWPKCTNDTDEESKREKRRWPGSKHRAEERGKSWRWKRTVINGKI